MKIEEISVAKRKIILWLVMGVVIIILAYFYAGRIQKNLENANLADFKRFFQSEQLKEIKEKINAEKKQ